MMLQSYFEDFVSDRTACVDGDATRPKPQIMTGSVQTKGTEMSKTTAAAVAAIFACVAAAPATAQTAPVAAVQVGDSALSCKALAAEINTLSQAQVQRTTRAAQGRKLFGFATAALTMATPLGALGALGGASGMGGLIGQMASQGAMSAAMQSASAPAAEAAPAATPESARIERLNALFAAKSC